jgi:hypothetical protein
MSNLVACDHTRGLCGKPDVPNDTPREVAELNPAHCLCCGSDMLVKDTTSLAMNELGMYWLICPVCPSLEKKLHD